MGHHAKVVIKTDQGAAIIDLFQTVAKARGESTHILETPGRNDSQGHGEAERAVQSIESMVRTFMDDLEERCGETLSVEDVCCSHGPLSMRAT